MRSPGSHTRWTVELHDGTVLEVWAHGFGRDGDHYTFANLVDLDDGEYLAADALVTATTPSNPRRVELASARIPKRAVRLRDRDAEWPAIYSA